MTGKEPIELFKEKNIEEQIDEILDYMVLIKRNLMGDKFSSVETKFYNIETFEPEKCPECGKFRVKFFLMMSPGQDLFDFSEDTPVITNFKIFCLDCTKKLDIKKNAFAQGKEENP
ncbi:MAG: hypothetical protein ACTSUE_13135 [Promethearchaeota archaeon]